MSSGAVADRRAQDWSVVFTPELVDRKVAIERMRVVVVPAGAHTELVGAARAVESAFAGSARVEAARRVPAVTMGGDAEIVRTHGPPAMEHVAVVRVLDVDGRVRAIVTLYDANGSSVVEIAAWADEPANADVPAVAPDPFPVSPTPDPAPPATPTPPVATDAERPLAEAPPPEKIEPDFDRIGVLGTASVGITNCAQNLCALVPVGGVGRFELGWRYKWIAPVVSFAIGGAPVDVPEESTAVPEGAPGDVKAALRFLDVGVGVQAFPVVSGRVDPFVRVGLAYSRVALVVKDSETKYRLHFSRGGVQLGGGLSIYVARHVSIGPRFDVVLPFAGKLCEELDGDAVAEEGTCRSTSDIVDSAESSTDERLTRRTFPKPWSATVDVRFVF